MADKVFRRTGSPVSGGSHLWFSTSLAGGLVQGEFFGFPAPPSGGLIKVWTGTAWVEKPMKYWNGSAWVQKPVKFWNGTTWTLS